MNKFVVGDRVTKTMGARLNGVIVDSFYWRESTDGTYNEPKPDYLPVAWDDGTQGYCYTGHLDYEYI